jgi:putative ABC transport system permease protein
MVNIVESTRIVTANMKARKLRSFLTLLGIIIGVSAIILLYSFAQSMEDAVGQQFDKLGSNRILITPKSVNIAAGASGSYGLTQEDMKVVDSVKEVDYTVAMLALAVSVEHDGQEELMQITGVVTDHVEEVFESFGWDMREGRHLMNGENTNSIVIGSKIAEEAFDEKIFVKNTIKINDKPFKVIGIVKETGNSQDDYMMVMPIEKARDTSETQTDDDGVTGITATIKKGSDLQRAADSIERKLKRAKDTENFVVTTPAKLKEQSKKVIGVVKQVILAIAAISLIVGGLGIMNSMYTAVLERTREIGVMKSIGAKNNDVLILFILEAAFLGLIGGLIGTVISLGVVSLADMVFYAQYNIHVVAKLSIIIESISFAIGIGIISGLLPALRAMKLKPVDALRYE